MSWDTWRRRSPSTLYFASMKSRSRTISSSERSRTRVAGSMRAAATVSCASDDPIPKMYVSPTATRLSRGRSTPAIRAIALPLTLLVPWVRADHHDPAATPDHFALLTHLADARTHLHDKPLTLPVWPSGRPAAPADRSARAPPIHSSSRHGDPLWSRGGSVSGLLTC